MTAPVLHLGTYDECHIPDHGLSEEQEIRCEIAFVVRAMWENQLQRQELEAEIHQLASEQARRPRRLRSAVEPQLEDLRQALSMLAKRAQQMPAELSSEAQGLLDGIV